MQKAEIIEEQINDTTLFGIIIETEDRKFRFPYISESKDEVIALLNRLKKDISPMHYNDIIEDYIIGKAYDRLKDNGL